MFQLLPGKIGDVQNPPPQIPAPGLPTEIPLPFEVDRQLPSSLFPNQARQAGPACTDASGVAERANTGAATAAATKAPAMSCRVRLVIGATLASPPGSVSA